MNSLSFPIFDKFNHLSLIESWFVSLNKIALRMPTAAVVAATVSLFCNGAIAQSAPLPPCAGPPIPAAGSVGDSLNQSIWMEAELPVGWYPPACTGWNAEATKVLLAAAGRFRMIGDSGVVVDRLARISTLTDIVYWSTSRAEWRALTGAAPGPPTRRESRERAPWAPPFI